MLTEVCLCCGIEITRVLMIKADKPALLLDKHEGSNLECNDDGNLTDQREDWLESHQRTLGRPRSQRALVSFAEAKDSSQGGDQEKVNP